MTDITDCHIIDLTRYLLKTDGKYQYEICKQQFSYILMDNYFNNNLSEREMECLFFTLRGKSSKTIGKILNLSAKTVEYYIDQLKIKLNCKNKAELIEHALTNGYLNVLPNRLVSTKLIEQIASD
jgi:DNA-binding CsgD family transcriptional regulator